MSLAIVHTLLASAISSVDYLSELRVGRESDINMYSGRDTPLYWWLPSGQNMTPIFNQNRYEEAHNVQLWIAKQDKESANNTESIAIIEDCEVLAQKALLYLYDELVGSSQGDITGVTITPVWKLKAQNIYTGVLLTFTMTVVSTESICEDATFGNTFTITTSAEGRFVLNLVSAVEQTIEVAWGLDTETFDLIAGSNALVHYFLDGQSKVVTVSLAVGQTSISAISCDSEDVTNIDISDISCLSLYLAGNDQLTFDFGTNINTNNFSLTLSNTYSYPTQLAVALASINTASNGTATGRVLNIYAGVIYASAGAVYTDGTSVVAKLWTVDYTLQNDVTAVRLISLNFNAENLAQSFALTETFSTISIDTPFTYLLTANLTYQWNATDTWGSPTISTTSISAYIVSMSNIATGFIRIVTAQTAFYEGGLNVRLSVLGTSSGATSLTVVYPTNRIDQDFLFYAKNFQIDTLTSSQAGDVLTYGVRTDDIGAGTDFNQFTLTTLAAVNALTTDSAYHGIHVFATEGTGNTGAPAKTLSMTGVFTDATAEKYIGIYDRQNNKAFRTALNNNAKIYDGALDYDVGTPSVDWERTQAMTVFFATYMTVIPPSGLARIFDNINFAAPGGGRGFQILYNNTSSLYFSLLSTPNTNQLGGIAGLTFKKGFNIGIITYDGSSSINGLSFYINGKKATTTTTVNNLSATTIGAAGQFSIGSHNGAPSGSKFAGNMRKLEFVNRVLTAAEIRRAYLLGTMLGIETAANFLLNVDFNKTGTSNLTYTIGAGAPVSMTASGGAAYTPFYI